METAGLILTTIPLLLTALEKYVETLDTIRLFRTDRYRRYLERYAITLTAQQASLLNAFEIALDIDVTKQGVDGLTDPTCRKWKDPNLQTKLQSKLSRDYDIFINVLSNANQILQELRHRLYNEIPIIVGLTLVGVSSC
ncbi:hypothetical protein BJX64DRAFT_257281 [Aspergillus heterothallicus]